MRITHDVGRGITLHTSHDEPTWRYVYAGKPKPYFHPLRTPSGHEVSLFEPHDHTWHRGLWFTFKFLNGENFWEENSPFGTQVLRTPPSIIHATDDELEVTHASAWVRPNDETIIDELRTFAHIPLGDDAYAIDFTTRLRPLADVLLDRTPFTTWGGYGGLIFRATRNWKTDRILLADGTTTERPTGQPAVAADLSGLLDGGARVYGGVAILDHPQNVRHPSPWYGKSGENHYLTAAPLFHEPLQLTADETLTLRYRVIIHNGMWDAAHLNNAWNIWLTGSSR